MIDKKQKLETSWGGQGKLIRKKRKKRKRPFFWCSIPLKNG